MPVDTYRRWDADTEGQLSDVADTISAPPTMLVAGTVDPTEYALGLRLLSYVGSAEDTAIIVTTTEGREEVVAHTRDVEAADGEPSLAVVDTVSEDQKPMCVPYW